MQTRERKNACMQGNARAAAGDLEQAKRLYVDALTLDNSSYCAQYNYGWEASKRAF